MGVFTQRADIIAAQTPQQ